MYKPSWMRKLQSDSGSNIVEFALCSSIWFICALGAVYVCVLVYAGDHFRDQCCQGTRPVTRWYEAPHGIGHLRFIVVSEPAPATAANVTSYIQSTLPPGLATNFLNVSASWPGITPSGAACDTLNGANSPKCASYQGPGNLLVPVSDAFYPADSRSPVGDFRDGHPRMRDT